MLLSIITPTILRPSLAETCRSIDEQKFTDYEHIVMVDRPNEDLSMIGPLKNEKRLFVLCARNHNDFGNSCRNIACGIAKGDYLAFCDDDDRYAPYAFRRLADALKEEPAWILFPALVGGDRWLKVPPGKGRTVSCQFAYQRKTALRWPDNPNYAADGELVDALLYLATPMILDIPECLAVVDKSRYGAP